MGVAVDNIKVGKCYVTALGQVRRVLEIGDGRVKYEARGRTLEGGSWGARATVGDGRFANDVEREVPCE